MDLDRVIERSDLDECPTCHGYTPARVFGAWSCERHAMGILDRVLLRARVQIPPIVPPDEDVVLVAV